MNCCLYARVSTDEQAERDLSLPAQLKALREYANKHNMTVVSEFVDEGESARTSDRPAFQRMISAAKQKEPPFQAILLWKLSRFARNREDSIIYKSLLRKRGIQVISINEKFDDSPTGKLMEALIESIDEFYSENLAQDTMRGLKENCLRGFWNGGTCPDGYDFDFVMVNGIKKRRLKINPKRAAIIKKIFAMCLKGEGIKDIAKILNDKGFRRSSGQKWTVQSVAYVLSNERYTGNLFWNEIRYNPSTKTPVIKVPHTHPAIVTEAVFNEARKKINLRTRTVTHPRTVASQYLLSGLVRCKKCGEMMTGAAAKSGRFHYYCCQGYLKRGRDYCSQKLIPAAQLEPLVINAIKEKVFTEANMRKLLLMVNDELKKFDGEYKDKLEMIQEVLEDKLHRRRKIYESMETGNVVLADVAPRLRELNSDIEQFEKQKSQIIEKHKDGEDLKVDEKRIKPFVDDLRSTLMTGSIAQRRGFIRSFVQKITANYPEIEIEYTIPLPVNNSSSTNEVLCIVRNGVPDWIKGRTLKLRVFLTPRPNICHSTESNPPVKSVRF